MSTQFFTTDKATLISFPAIPTERAGESDSAGGGWLGDSDFFKGKSLAELAREQGVGPVNDISVFAGGIPDDEDVDEMVAEIYRLREP